MTDEPTVRPHQRNLARQDRLRQALRENLKRRKAQSRGRTGQTAATPDQGTCDRDPACSHGQRSEQEDT